MTPALIMQQAQADGVQLVLSPAGTIKVIGSGKAVNRWFDVIRENKPEIIDVLKTSVFIPEKTSRWWLLHYRHRDPVKVVCSFEATQAEMLKWYPEAVIAEPSAPIFRKPSTALTHCEEQRIRTWLTLIEETDPATIAEIMNQCHCNAEVRDYFLLRAKEELPKPAVFPDDDAPALFVET